MEKRINRTTISLGKILGVRLELDYSWFLIFGLIVISLSASYFPDRFESWSTPEYWLAGGITGVLFFVSVVLHELGHSLTAIYFGVPVRRITLFIFGGAAQMTEEPSKPKEEFLIAIAGPLVSIVLAIGLAVSQLVLPDSSLILGIALYLAYINALLAGFNLIPGFPLDGGRVLRAFIWRLTDNLERATQISGTAGRIVAYAFIIIGGAQILMGDFSGLWIAFIGWFLDSAARSEMQQQIFRSALDNITVSEVMSQDNPEVAADTILQDVIDRGILGNGKSSFLVTDHGRIRGLLTLQQIKDIDREKWPTTTAAEAMFPKDDFLHVQPTADLWDALRLMAMRGLNQLPVVKNDQVMGLLRREDIVEFVRLRRELRTAKGSLGGS